MSLSRTAFRARTRLHIPALVLALSASALVLSACGHSDLGPGDVIGSVEGYGGLGGRVGAPVAYESVAQSPPPMRIGSTEGYGGYVGRVGQPVLSPDAVEAAQQQQR